MWYLTFYLKQALLIFRVNHIMPGKCLDRKCSFKYKTNKIVNYLPLAETIDWNLAEKNL